MIRTSLTATTALLLGTLMLEATTASAQVRCPQAISAGPPAVNSQNIFCGEIRGNPARANGFHSRPGGANPNSVFNTGEPMAALLAPAGIYRLINFEITQEGVVRVKAVSTMFPDACNQEAILAAIRHAAQGAQPGQQFRGTSGSACQALGDPPTPFNIVGFMSVSGEIITAWPDY